MEPMNTPFETSNWRISRSAILRIGIFILIAAAGLMYVKWWPYYHKALTASETHAIGKSILEGTDKGTLWDSSLAYATTYFKSVWKASLLGLILASLIQVLLPVNWLQRVIGRSSLKGSLIGGASSLPGMMCTCCAAPIAVSMRQQKLSIGASLAFWLGNPVLNPAVLVFMSFVLGWEFTALRVVFGLIITIGISYLASRFADRLQLDEHSIAKLKPTSKQIEGTFALRWIRSFWSMFIRIIPLYVVMVFILGALQSLLLPLWAANSIVLIVMLAFVGTLLVIPTAAEIPIIQSLLTAGVGAGPASALLITLPTISLPSLLLVARAFPRSVLYFVALSVFVLGILCGLIGGLWGIG